MQGHAAPPRTFCIERERKRKRHREREREREREGEVAIARITSTKIKYVQQITCLEQIEIDA